MTSMSAAQNTMFKRLMGKVKFHRQEVPLSPADLQEADQVQRKLQEELEELEVDLHDPGTAAAIMGAIELVMGRRAMKQRHLEADEDVHPKLALIGSVMDMALELQMLAESIVYKHGQDVAAKCTFCTDDNP